MSWLEQGRNPRDLRYIRPELRMMPAPSPLIVSICYESSENSKGWVLDTCFGTRFLACFLHGNLAHAIASLSHLTKVRVLISQWHIFITGIKFTKQMMAIVNTKLPPNTLIEIKKEEVSRGRDEVVWETCERGFQDLQCRLAERNSEIQAFRQLRSIKCTATD